MDASAGVDYLRFAASLIFVLCLMGGLALLVKKAGLAGAAVIPQNKRRLKVVEILPIDSRHRAVILRKDRREYLIMLNPEGETVIESGTEVCDEPNE